MIKPIVEYFSTSVNQTIYQEIDSLNTNQSTISPVHQSVNQSFNQSTNQSVINREMIAKKLWIQTIELDTNFSLE